MSKAVQLQLNVGAKGQNKAVYRYLYKFYNRKQL